MKALSIIQLCAREFNDTGYIRIGRDTTSYAVQFPDNPNGAVWLDWLNDAARTIVLVRPDAGAVTESFQCVAGARQALGATRQRLLDVTCNMGADGLTRGKTVRLVDGQMKNDISRSWMNAAPATEAREVIYSDKKDPKTFYVSPPIGTRYLEIVSCKQPSTILDADVATADFQLDDLYAGPAQTWMMHRSYAMATNAPANYTKAWNYFSSFFQQLGVKLRGEMFAAAATPANLPRAQGTA